MYVVEERRIRAEAVPKGAVDCIGERMPAYSLLTAPPLLTGTASTL